MSNERFRYCLQFTLKWEGGFVNNPKDPGGATNRGITQRTYDSWRRAKGLPTQSVSMISKEEVEEIYYSSYWEPWCSDMPPPMDLALFDSFVNLGHGGTALLWQPVINVKVDGIWGRVTQAATLEFARLGPRRAAGELAIARIRYRIRRVSERPDQKIFLAGWISRDCDLVREILK